MADSSDRIFDGFFEAYGIMEIKINERALFADESGSYRIPEEPESGDTVKIRLRTRTEDADKVNLIICTKTDSKYKSIPMKRIICGKRQSNYVNVFPVPEWGHSYLADSDQGKLDNGFDFYEAEYKLGEEPVWYYYVIKKGRTSVHYTKLGADQPVKHDFRHMFVLRPGVHVPEWAKGAVYYQIFTDRFFNGDPSNDVRDGEYYYVDGIPVQKAGKWDEETKSLDVGHFFGGDLQGIINKLDHIKSLGVTVIWLNPIFVSPSNHKYDTQDYDHIDPHYGKIVNDIPESAYKPQVFDGKPETEKADGSLAGNNRTSKRYIKAVTDPENLAASDRLFAKLCEEAHKRGIRIILDGVFNHCGSFNRWMDREGIYENAAGEFLPGAYANAGSPYRKYFKFTKDQWPNNKSYMAWWDVYTLPKLNYEESEDLCAEICRIGSKWVSAPFGADGWRLDVGADLGQTREFNHKFWKRFRKAVKSANPDALIFAEHFFDSSEWLQGDEWDSVMNYEGFMDPISWFLTGLEKHSYNYDAQRHNNGALFQNTMTQAMCQYHRGAMLAALNEHSNHDHSRFMTRTNSHTGTFAKMGTEAAGKDLNDGIFKEGYVMSMTWPGAPGIYYGDETGMTGWTDPDNRRPYPWNHQRYDLIDFFVCIGQIHNRNQALKTGSFKFLGAGDGLVMYGRFQEENRLAVAVNNLSTSRTISIPVWELGIPENSEMERLIYTTRETCNVGSVKYKVEKGCISMTMDPFSSVILKYI